MAANILISGDYEYCLSICSHDFSHVTKNISLFDGNILRFKSLAAERFFQYINAFPNPQERLSMPSSQEFKQLSNLFLAIESAKNALEIYKNRTIDKKPYPNIYGMALQQYQLGYLYGKYATVLSTEQAQKLDDC